MKKKKKKNLPGKKTGQHWKAVNILKKEWHWVKIDPRQHTVYIQTEIEKLQS